MSRSRSRARKRAFNALNWGDQRRIINAATNVAQRKASTPKPKPEWVAQVESSGYQTIGGDRRSSRATGLTRDQREANRADRKARKAVKNVHTHKVRQVRADGRDTLMAGTYGLTGQRPKLLVLPRTLILRSSLLPAYRKQRSAPTPYTR